MAMIPTMSAFSITTQELRSISMCPRRLLLFRCVTVLAIVMIYEREVAALKKLPSVLECRRRLIVTFDEEASIEDDYGKIEILPYWKWAVICWEHPVKE